MRTTTLPPLPSYDRTLSNIESTGLGGSIHPYGTLHPLEDSQLKADRAYAAALTLHKGNHPAAVAYLANHEKTRKAKVRAAGSSMHVAVAAHNELAALCGQLAKLTPKAFAAKVDQYVAAAQQEAMARAGEAVPSVEDIIADTKLATARIELKEAAKARLAAAEKLDEAVANLAAALDVFNRAGERVNKAAVAATVPVGDVDSGALHFNGLADAALSTQVEILRVQRQPAAERVSNNLKRWL